MNESDRQEIESIRDQIRALRRDHNLAGRTIDQLQLRLKQLEQKLTLPPPETPVPRAATAIPPPLPSRPKPVESPTAPASTTPPPIEPPPIIPTSKPPPPPKVSWEFYIGKYILPVVGIGAMLTALVFFAFYIHARLPKAGKVAVLYAACAVGIWLGAWLEKKYEQLGRWIFAGGLAGTYFVTYALHYIETLRLLDSALVCGVALLCIVAAIVGIAQWRKNPWLAGMAILLGFYTSAITEVHTFTLISNCFLAAGALYLMLVSGWAPLTGLALVGTYGTYAIWLFRTSEETSVQFKMWFVLLYWALFTLAVFAGRRGLVTDIARNLFATLNNMLGFAFLTHAVLHHDLRYHHWKLSFWFGGTLLGLAMVGRYRFTEKNTTFATYLITGLAVVTLGVVEKWAGFKTIAALAVEAGLLIALGHLLRQPILRYFGVGVQALCLFKMYLAFDRAASSDPNREIATWFAVAIAYGNAFLQRWQTRPEKGALRDSATERGLATCLAILAHTGLFFATWDFVPEPWRTAAFGIEALALMTAGHVLRQPIHRWAGAAFQVLCVFLMILEFRKTSPGHARAIATWVAVACGYALAFIQHFQTRREKGPLWERTDERALAAMLATLANLALLIANWDFVPERWRATAAAIECAVIAGVAGWLRAWSLVLSSQMLLLTAYGSLFGGMLAHWSRPGPLDVPWVIGLVSVGCAWCFDRVAARIKDDGKRTLTAIGVTLHLVGVVIVVLSSLGQRLDPDWHLWTMTLTAVGCMAVARFWPNPAWRWLGWITACIAFGVWVFHEADGLIHWKQNLAVAAQFLGLALWVVFERLTTAIWPREQLHEHTRQLIRVASVIAIVVMSLAFLWRWASREYVTATWVIGGFALFGLGLLFKERSYRRAALAVIALSLLRAAFYDSMQIQKPLLRILCFFAIGAVTLLLGLFYAKLEKAVRSWEENDAEKT